MTHRLSDNEFHELAHEISKTMVLRTYGLAEAVEVLITVQLALMITQKSDHVTMDQIAEALCNTVKRIAKQGIPKPNLS